MHPRLLVALVALACGLTVAPVAPASAQGSYRYALITFHKNHQNAHRSMLVWRVYRVSGGTTTTVVRKKWRAGSGYFPDSTNACAKNRGWLPNGRYRPALFNDYHGSVIKGRAIYLGQKRCANGTLRTALFIHTEQGAGSRQCADRKGDQPCRWEYPKYNDYRSYGCIKVAPGAMKELHDAWRRYFRLGYAERVRVRVR
jgi:hypothetical protein